jgi:hypothetical protein
MNPSADSGKPIADGLSFALVLLMENRLPPIQHDVTLCQGP